MSSAGKFDVGRSSPYTQITSVIKTQSVRVSFRSTLCSEEVLTFINTRMLFWACSTSKPEGFRGNRNLRRWLMSRWTLWLRLADYVLFQFCVQSLRPCVRTPIPSWLWSCWRTGRWLSLGDWRGWSSPRILLTSWPSSWRQTRHISCQKD